MHRFVPIFDLAPFSPVAGVTMRSLSGEGAMLNLVELGPGATVPAHSHPQEQLGYVLRGEITMTVEGSTYVCGEHYAYTIAGGVEHAGVAGSDGCLVLDVFQPVREDYRAAAAAAERA